MTLHWPQQTHKEQQALVFADGPAAAQEAQQEQHASHGQDDVHAHEQQGVSRHDLSEAHRVHQHPHTNSQQEGATQLWHAGLNNHRVDGKEVQVGSEHSRDTAFEQGNGQLQSN